MTNCSKCKRQNVYFLDPEYDNWCADCTNIAESRYSIKRDWRLFHSEPCPESHLPQFNIHSEAD